MGITEFNQAFSAGVTLLCFCRAPAVLNVHNPFRQARAAIYPYQLRIIGRDFDMLIGFGISTLRA